MNTLSDTSCSFREIEQSVQPSMDEMAKSFQAINNKEDFGQLSNTILEQATMLTGALAAALLLVNKNTGELEIAAVRQVPEEVITNYMQHPVRAAAIADFYKRSGNAFELSFHFDGIRQLASAGYDHSLVLPINIRQKIIGYLTLSSANAFLDNSAARDRFGLYLEFSAQAIESAYFIYQLQQQNAHLELMMTKLQNTQNHLKRTEKMALVGKLAASVAHEIRNPLTIIGTSLQLTYEKLEKAHPDKELFETMINKVRSVDQTIKELMVFARPIQLVLKSFGLENTLDRVITFVSRKFASKGISITKDIPQSLPPVYLDEEQTQRILINLLLNAFEFLDEKGSISLIARYESHQPWISLTVADDGKGIPKENIRQIFDPFFTTRTEGSGLGLFMVKHLIEEMDGSIEVDNQKPHGAVFVLRLPVIK